MRPGNSATSCWVEPLPTSVRFPENTRVLAHAHEGCAPAALRWGCSPGGLLVLVPATEENGSGCRSGSQLLVFGTRGIRSICVQISCERVHPDGPEQGGGSGCWGCAGVSAVPRLGPGVHSVTHTCAAHILCGSVLCARVLVGDTGPGLPLALPEDTQLRASSLSGQLIQQLPTAGIWEGPPCSEQGQSEAAQGCTPSVFLMPPRMRTPQSPWVTLSSV